VIFGPVPGSIRESRQGAHTWPANIHLTAVLSGARRLIVFRALYFACTGAQGQTVRVPMDRYPKFTNSDRTLTGTLSGPLVVGRVRASNFCPPGMLMDPQANGYSPGHYKGHGSNRSFCQNE